VILSRGASLQVPPLDGGVRMARTAAPQASTLEHTVREHILEVLRETNGVVAGPRGAAVRLGLKRTTLQSKMEKLGIGPGGRDHGARAASGHAVGAIDHALIRARSSHSGTRRA
jgi:hypothetical protein